MIQSDKRAPQFSLGPVVATPGALEALESSRQSAHDFLRRHVVLDPGELCEEDQQHNADAVTNGDRVLSSYETQTGTKLWIITEHDRSVTTILLPDEY